uniref:Uncharacterized protein n=1 Tax=Tetraselmis sp. GSL018 TaxID=582737 RepID=A0A061SF40_9CHLO
MSSCRRAPIRMGTQKQQKQQQTHYERS